MSRSVILELEDLDDLERAARLASWLNRPPVEKVLVTLPWLDPGEQSRSAKALHRLFNDCGCLWGGPVFLVALTGSIATRRSGGTMWTDVGASLLVAVLAALVAKFLGLAVSRWRLRVWLRRLLPPNGAARLTEDGVR